MSGVEGLVARLRKRLATASMGDRQYERPMNWDEADQLVDTITALQSRVDHLQALVDAFQQENPPLTNAALQSQLAASIAAARQHEYICKCGLRVEPHRCRDTKGEF